MDTGKQIYPLSRTTSLTKCAAESARLELADRLLPSEAIELVSALVGAYPNGQPHDPKGYIGTLARLLCQYPRSIATLCADPIHGVARTTKFLPSTMEMIAFCEDRVGLLTHTIKRQARIEKQLQERDEWERGPAEPPPRQTIEEFHAEMRDRGLPMGGKAGHKETPASVRAKLGISQEQWDAIPDAPARGSWDRLVAKHAAGDAA
jgi:hypothetical protein